MTPEQFKISWERNGEVLSTFSRDDLSTFGLKEGTMNFLCTAGLPESAAPFLTFVQRNGDKYNNICRLPELYDFLEKNFDQYVYIGYDGSGNPIIINTGDEDKIEWLDHEDLFSSNYFNSSIEAMASCLIAQRMFTETLSSENGPDAYFNSNFTDKQFEKFKGDIGAADPQCLFKEGFWKDCLDVELSMREESRKNL